MDLLDRVPVGEGDEVEQVLQPVGRVQVVVGLRVWCRRSCSSVSWLAIRLPDAVLVLGPADEVLLARVADEVGVGVAEAHERPARLVAAQLLVAGLDVDARVVGQRGVVVVAVIDVGVDAADRVDQILEAAEVDVEDVVDLQLREDLLLERLDQQVRAALRVGGVELVAWPMPGICTLRSRGIDITLIVYELGIEPDQHHRVGVGGGVTARPHGGRSRSAAASGVARGWRS